ncbi:MAG TPA: SBBP repeat-containing protein, partial [Bacteroidia bacterium]
MAFACLCCFTDLAAQPVWQWAKDAHTGSNEHGEDIAIDYLTGNVIICGYYEGSGLASFYGSSFSGTSKGGFVAKYDANGNVLWGFKIGSNHNNICKGVAVDSAGNIYVTGSFEGTTDFRGLSATISNLSSVGNKDVFLAKYNSAGQLIWAKRGGGGSNDEGTSVALNSSGVFISGTYGSSASFDTYSTAAPGSSQKVFVTAYNTSGNVVWLADAGSSAFSRCNDICADASHVFISGEFEGSTLSIYNSGGAFAGSLSNVNSGKTEGYIISLSASGVYNWGVRVSSFDDDRVNSITVSSSMLYITGAIKQSANFPGYSNNPVSNIGSNYDSYVAQLLKTSGVTQWVKRENSNGEDEGLAIAADTLGNVYITGFYKDGITFAGTGGGTLSASGGQEEQVFVASYSSAGTIRFARDAGDDDTDKAYGIAVASPSVVYVCGEYEDDADFGFISLADNGGSNIFVAKMACPAIVNNNISTSQTICTGSTPSLLIGTIPGGGAAPFTYLWEQSSDNISWIAASGINNLPNYSSPALTDTTYFRRTAVTGPACYGSSISNTIVVYTQEPPTISAAGPNQVICINSAATVLNGNVPSIGTGLWTLVSGAGSIASPSDPASAVNALAAGNNVFKWTILNGACPSSSSTVNIFVDRMPDIAAAGSDQTVCISSAAASFSGNAPVIGSGVWSLVSGTGNISNPSSASSPVNSLSLGTNVFTWSISNGVCPVSVDSVRIFVDQLPSPSVAGPDQVICISSPNTTMAGNVPVVGNGTWSLITAAGNIGSPSLNNSAVNNLAVGNNDLVWTITNGVCASSKDTIRVLVQPMPTVSSAGADQNICISAGGTTLNANSPVIGNGIWTRVSGSGTITAPSSPSSPVSGTAVGSNVFVWTISNGVCASSRDTMVVFVDALPSTAFAGADQTVCVSSPSAILTGNNPSVGTGIWAMVSGTGNISAPASLSTNVNALSVGNNQFKWEISNGTCPSSSDIVSVFVDPLPTASSAGADQTICISAGGTTLNANNPVIGNGIWTRFSGSGTILTPSSPSSSVAG